MFAIPRGWETRYGANLVLATSPGQRLEIRDRQPVVTFTNVVEDALRRGADFRVREVSDVTRITTNEGEYAALVTLRGEHVQRHVGAVFLGDFICTIDLYAGAASLAQELLQTARFQLGDRPRQFFYTPPHGWQGLAAGLATTWYPPGFPGKRAMLVVPPATRIDGDVEAVVAGCMGEHVIETREQFSIERGLHERWSVRRVDGHPLVREVIAFVIDARAYVFRLDSSEVIEGLLRSTALSFEPLPAISPQTRDIAAVAEHWLG